MSSPTTGTVHVRYLDDVRAAVELFPPAAA